jgi:hypothetical protein
MRVEHINDAHDAIAFLRRTAADVKRVVEVLAIYRNTDDDYDIRAKCRTLAGACTNFVNAVEATTA